MPRPDATRVTQLLVRVREGEDGASGELLSLVYDELRGVARNMFEDAGGHTLQPTAIVHEAFIKLAG